MNPLPSPPEGYASRMRLQAEADRLERVGRRPDGKPLELAPVAALAWRAMRAAAEMDGVVLVLVSAFRSVARQREIVATKLEKGQALEAILRVNAYPGFSEHHTGRAVDVGTPGCEPLTEAFEATKAFRWLAENGARFGFTLSYPKENPAGVVYEPWHWCHDGGRRDAGDESGRSATAAPSL